MPQIPVYQQQTIANPIEQPAQMQAPQVGNYIAKDLEAVGSALSQVGAQGISYADFQERTKQAQIQQSSNIWADNAASQNQLAIHKKLNELQNTVGSSGAGMTDELMKYIDDLNNQTIANANPLAAQKYNDKMNGIRVQYGNQALDLEQKFYAADLVNQSKNTVNNEAQMSLATNGAYFTKAVDNVKGLVNNLHTTPIERAKLQKDWTRQVAFTTLDGMLVNGNAQGVLDALSNTNVKNPKNPYALAINTSANNNNVNPNLMYGLMDSESGINFNAKNPKSSAFGALQFTNSTWKEFGGTDANRSDPATQIDLAGKYIANVTNQTQASIGRPLSPGEAKIAVVYRGNAPAIINAPSDMPIEKVIGAKTAQINNIAGMTAGQAREHYEDIMQKQLKKYGNPGSAIANELTPQELLTFQNKAFSLQKQQQDSNHFAFDNTVKNQVAQMNEGIIPTNLLTAKEFAGRYSDPTEQAAKYAEFTDNLTGAMQSHQLVGMTNAQALATYNSMPSDPKSINYAQEVKNKESFLKQIQTKNNAIQNDPANYFINRDSNIANLYNIAQNNPADINAQQNYFQALSAQKLAQGITSPNLLPASDEYKLISTLSSLSGSDLVNKLTSLQGSYGQYYSNVMKQIQANSAAPKDLAAILVAPSPAIQNQIATNSRIPLPDKIKGFDSSKYTTGDIKSAVNNAMSPFYNSIDPNSIPGKTFDSLVEAVTKLTYDNMKVLGNPTNAAQLAFDSVLGKDKYNYLDNSNDSQLRVPKEYSKDVVQSNLDNVIDNLSINNLAVPEEKLLTIPWTGKKTADGYIKQIKNNYMWYTNKNEDGAVLYFKADNNLSYPVLDKSGKQIQMPFNSNNKTVAKSLPDIDLQRLIAR